MGGMRSLNGPASNRMVDAVRAAGTAGIDVDTLAERLSLSRDYVIDALNRLRLAERVSSGHDPAERSRRARRWWAPEFARAGLAAVMREQLEQQHAKRRALSELAQPPSRRRLDPATPAVVPPGVRVQVCPSGRDQRYTFTPPPGWRGTITRDWIERRQAQAKERHEC